jgi:hypothetical protein
MARIHIPKPDYIGTTPELVARSLRARNPGLNYRDWKALTRATLGRRYLDQEVCVLRAPGNAKRMIAVDTPLPSLPEAQVEGTALILWVGEKGDIFIELDRMQQGRGEQRPHGKGQADGPQE